MDFVSQRHLLHESQTPLPSSHFYETTHPSSTNFPLLAILVIGMMITSFFLIGYYMLVIKCCLNWHHVGHRRPFSLSRHGEDPSVAYSTASEPRGLEESVIKLIPVIHYNPEEGDRDFGERSFSECAVCLSEFQHDEKLRVIPNCSHVFHIDCIDVWLQNNAHCPLCRRTVSLTSQVHVDQVHVDQVQLLTPRPSPQGQSQNIENLIGADEGFVVIDLDSEHDRDQNLQGRQEELTTGPISLSSQRKLLEQKIARKLQKVTSLGDECIGIRAKDERFSVQAMRRSFSMDSSVNRQFCGTVQQVLQQQNGHVHEVSTIEACGDSDRVKRSFFSFGHGSRSRSVVLPVYLDP
ncbi:RING-H2 finger protein ATL1 [Spatholobus suberectus]|nr:RING-H2 finger protein ATL1 [Spatholobus suberectus]